jgi:hypothetical protein
VSSFVFFACDNDVFPNQPIIKAAVMATVKIIEDKIKRNLGAY